MKRFSEREGYKQVRTEIQGDSMDTSLRNRLWNVLDLFCWAPETQYYEALPIDRSMSREMRGFLNTMWHSFFKEPVDTILDDWRQTYNLLRKRFFESEWFEVYDFIEYVARKYFDSSVTSNFKKACNRVLEEEVSAYRLVGDKITKVTSEVEISEIEEALATPIKPVRSHLEKATSLMSDRKSPDYRNSIKESISAVEALCRLISKKEKDTLGQALKEVEAKVVLHPALKKGFSNLYGYTSSADGIRHALMDEPNLSFGDGSSCWFHAHIDEVTKILSHLDKLYGIEAMFVRLKTRKFKFPEITQ